MAKSDTQTAAANAAPHQIEEALELLRKQMADNPGGVATSGLALSCAQSLALAVQDAVDHTRRMQMIAEARAAKGDDGSALVEGAMASLKQMTTLAAETVQALQTPG